VSAAEELAEPDHEPALEPEPEPEPESSPESGTEDTSRAERLDQISAQITEAKARLAAEAEHFEATDEYQARIAAEAEPEAVAETEPA
jgi:hypothetical protein